MLHKLVARLQWRQARAICFDNVVELATHAPKNLFNATIRRGAWQIAPIVYAWHDSRAHLPSLQPNDAQQYREQQQLNPTTFGYATQLPSDLALTKYIHIYAHT